MTQGLRWAWLCPVVALAGCGSIGYTPVLVDSPLPAVFREARPGNAPCGPTLVPGQSCVTLVRAEDWYSDTRIRVEAKQTYCFHVPAGQVWFDAERRNSPPRGEPGSLFMNALKRAKRQDAPWFTLMAGVAPDPVPTLRPVAWAGPPSREFTASLEASTPHNVAADPLKPLVVAKNGVLVLYPNDAWGPTGRPGYFYENNSGQIWVQVSHVPAGKACTGAPAA